MLALCITFTAWAFTSIVATRTHAWLGAEPPRANVMRAQPGMTLARWLVCIAALALWVRGAGWELGIPWFLSVAMLSGGAAVLLAPLGARAVAGLWLVTSAGAAIALVDAAVG